MNTPIQPQTIANPLEIPAILTETIFAEMLTDYFDGLSGMIGVAVHDFATGTDFVYNATEIFPTASTLKVPLLYTFYRLVDAGELDPTERVTLSSANRVPGSGVLQHLDEGLQPTLRDLAELMITVSDNWATDLLWSRMGKTTVDTMMTELGLIQTSLPMTIFELFATLANLDPNDPATTYEMLDEFLDHGEDTDPDNPALAFDTRNDTSSPADMVRLLKAIDAGEGISEASRDAMLTILKHQNFTTIIPARLPPGEDIETAHKTGSLSGAKNDVGLVFSPKAHYAIAFLSRSQDDIPEVVDRMARVSRWIYDSLANRSTS